LRKRGFSIGFLSLVLVLSLFLTGCGQDNIPSEFEFDRLREPSADPLIIGQVPSRSVIELFEERKAFLRLLSKSLDRNFELRVADTYDGIIRGMEREQLDLAVLGPLAYVKAVDELNAPYRPLVRPVRYGNPYYRSMIITNPQSGIDSLSDLRGQSMAFVDPTSTSGYLFPRAHIIQNAGFDPFEATSRTSFLGGHDRVVEAVLSGAYDAGAVFDDARTLVLDGNLDQKLPVVDRTRPIPSEPISVRTDLSDETIQKLRQFFLTLHENHPDVLKSLGSNIDRYVEANDADYDDVRTVKSVLEDVPEP
jgi:phosphonate transport system substrate-binding protein